MVRDHSPGYESGRPKHKKKHQRRSKSRSRSPVHNKKKAKQYSRSRSPLPVKIKEEPITPPRAERKTEYESQKHRDHRSRETNFSSRHVSPSRRDERYQRSKPIKKEHRSEQQAERRRHDDRRREARHNREDNNPFRSREEDNMEFGRNNREAATNEEEKPKEAPDFKPSGKLTEETNTYRGVVIKYNQPPEARKPKKRWRLYPFKGDEALPVLHIHRQSAYLIGRDRLVVDIPTDHPSCSKQHAVLQFRMVDFEREDGTKGRRIAPYVIDLDSSNGTFVNNKKIEAQRFYELFEKDVLKFGFSSREFVLLHDKSAEGVEEEGSPE